MKNPNLQVTLLVPGLDLGRGPGPGPPTKEGPHHVHVFSHMCDMCVPLS